MRFNYFKIALSVLFSLLQIKAFSQIKNNSTIGITIQVDSMRFTSENNSIQIADERFVSFLYSKANEVVQVKIHNLDKQNIRKIVLLNSGDYAVIDTLVKVNQYSYQMKVQFKDLNSSKFLNFKFRISNSISDTIEEIKLLPFTQTNVSILHEKSEIYIGEEKVIELNTNNAENIKTNSEWVKNGDLNYKISLSNGILKLHVLANEIGTKNLKIQLKLNNPFLDSLKRLNSDLEIEQQFEIKRRRFLYLNVDQKEVVFDENAQKEGIEIQIDNFKNLKIKKTYRIEASEKYGGELIAELFTLSSLVNDKALCRLRIYNLHKQSDGFLYIKDGDKVQFLTNFNIVKKTNINKIRILSKGSEWVETNNLNPGQFSSVKLEGENMLNAHFIFNGLSGVFTDTLQNTDKQAVFNFKVPIDICIKKIAIFLGKENTGKSLNVSEFILPRKFDYVNLKCGTEFYNAAQISSPEIITKSIKNISIYFAQDKIDSLNQLFGKQFLSIDIRITGKNNQVYDIQSIPSFCICPGNSSPRSTYYDCKECLTELNLNSYLNTQIYNLNEWTKISLTLKNDQSKYNEKSYEKKIDFILQRTLNYDVDVSFPGLLTYVQNEGWKGGLGVSMALIGQLSFYDGKKIGILRPFKLGAGFLALNAFNLSSKDVYRDLGLVFLSNFTPIRRDRKFTFPLYLGGGFLLNANKWFYVVGPGIGVSF